MSLTHDLGNFWHVFNQRKINNSAWNFIIVNIKLNWWYKCDRIISTWVRDVGVFSQKNIKKLKSWPKKSLSLIIFFSPGLKYGHRFVFFKTFFYEEILLKAKVFSGSETQVSLTHAMNILYISVKFFVVVEFSRFLG